MDNANAKYPARLWFAAICAWLGSFQFGFHLVGGIGVHCVNTATTHKRDHFLQGVLNTCLAYVSQDVGVTEAKGGAVMTSILLVGAAAGGFFAGQVADAVGPCKTLQYNNVYLFSGSLLACTAPPGARGFWGMLLGTPCQPAQLAVEEPTTTTLSQHFQALACLSCRTGCSQDVRIATLEAAVSNSMHCRNEAAPYPTHILKTPDCSAGRMLAGSGVGTASLVVPRYLVEIAPTPIRGALGTFNQVLTQAWQQDILAHSSVARITPASKLHPVVQKNCHLD